jgi:pseudouridine-5'-phosphate glycosidase
VPTAVYRSDEFPAFWSRGSGLPAPLRCDDPAAIAAIFRTACQLETGNGMLVANPIDPALEIPHDTIAEIIERAVTEAARQQIGGKALTPWLLDRVFTLTQGRSLEANIGLVRSNARLAAEIASQLLLVG